MKTGSLTTFGCGAILGAVSLFLTSPLAAAETARSKESVKKESIKKALAVANAKKKRDLDSLLTPEEREAIKNEAARQRHADKTETKKENPGTLTDTKDNRQKERRAAKEKREDAQKEKAKREDAQREKAEKKRTRSLSRDPFRYRPGASAGRDLKSTPAQRAFGS